MNLGGNKEKNLRSLGFNREVDRTKFDLCPLCGQPIKMEDFNNELSRKEYFVSGMCQKCIDDMFGKHPDEF